MSVDVHLEPPADCTACAPRKACLEHTCPDCGAIVHNERNAANELTHACCAYCVRYADSFAPRHFASDRCQSGKHSHCSCDTCF